MHGGSCDHVLSKVSLKRYDLGEASRPHIVKSLTCIKGNYVHVQHVHVMLCGVGACRVVIYTLYIYIYHLSFQILPFQTH